MAVLSFAVGGYLYYSALIRHSEARAHKEAVEELRDLGNTIDIFFTWSLMSVKSIAGLKELKHALLKTHDVALKDADAILKQFCDDLKVNVCYLMDSFGNTVASSNHGELNSFVGKNYGFRPYFQKAIQGSPSVYMALGITSKERGIYYSHPVFDNEGKTPMGVAVIKASVEIIEKDFMKPYHGVVLLTDPHGLVFVSNRSDWLYHFLWQVSSETISEIGERGQFGKGPWNWTGMKLINKDTAVDSLGNKYRVHEQGLVNYPDWHLIYLHSQGDIMKTVIEPLRKTVGVVAVVLCFAFGIAVLFLFFKANNEIVQRKLAQKEREDMIVKLQNTLAEIKTLRGILPICSSCKKIRDDKGYWNQIESYISSYSSAEFSHGICPECSDLLYGHEDWYIALKKEEEEEEQK